MTFINKTLIFILLISGAVIDAVAAQDEDSTIHEEQIDEVVVTGQYTPQGLARSVFKINVINREKIEAKAATSLMQVLNTELGVRYSNDLALGTSDISLMGMTGRSIKILIDGVPVLDRGDIRESLNQMDISQIERLEIVEGPMSIVYGSDALSGVINIITKKAARESWGVNARIQEETVGTEYKPAYNKGLHSQYIGGYWDNGKWNITASLNHYDFGGFQGDAYNRNHSWKPKEQWIPSLKIGYRSAKWSIHYRPDYLYETIDTRSPINFDTYKGTNKRFITNKTAHQLQGAYFINDKWSMNSFLNYTNYSRQTETEIVDFTNGSRTPATGMGDQDNARFNTFNFRTTFQYILSDQLSFQPGVEINRDAASGDRIEGNPTINDLSAFLSAEYKPLEWMNIRPGVRMTKNSIYDAPPLIPSINTLFRISDELSLRASYARGYRAPALRELYFNFVDANHNLKGNPDLKAEYSNSFNVSLLYTRILGNGWIFTSDLGTFYNNYDNLISLAVNPDNPNEYINVNIDKYKNSGINWKNKLKKDNVEISLGGLYLGQYNYLHDEGGFQDIPLFNWSPEVNVELLYKIKRTGTTLSLFYKFTGRRQGYYAITDSSGNHSLGINKIDPYHYADFSINQEVVKHLNITAGVRNIFDLVNIQSTGGGTGGAHSSGSAISFGYGRSYFISLNFNINNK